MILGQKIESINGLDFYLYPQKNLTKEELNKSLNLLCIGETGVGKSTMIHSFINYIQQIQFEETVRYLLFNEKYQTEQYEKVNGKKPIGFSTTNEPSIYNIESSTLCENPIRLIDTEGFGSTKGIEYDKKAFNNIKNLFKNSDIESINAICLFLKANETRNHLSLLYILNYILSLFGDRAIKNIIIIFTFCDNTNNIPSLENLKRNNSPLNNFFNNLDDIDYFAFNNIAFFINNNNFLLEREYNQNLQSFYKMIKYIKTLKRISFVKKNKLYI